MIKLRSLITKIIDYTFPLCILTTLVLLLGAKYIVLFWVGQEYANSIIILQILIIGTGFGFITQPASYYFMAKTKYRFIYLTAVILPVLFFLGVIILTPTMGIQAFALSKSMAMFAGFILSTIGLYSIINPMKIMRKWVLSLLVVSSFLILFLPNLLTSIFNVQEKNSIHIALLVSLLGVIIGLSYCLIIFTQKQQRSELKIIFIKIRFLLNKNIKDKLKK